MRLFLKNQSGNAVSYVVPANGAYLLLDLANTTYWGESTAGPHPDITLVNATNDHILLTAGGVYHIVVSIEFFPASNQNRDMWLVVSTDANSTGQLGTDRLQSLSTSAVGNVQMKHQAVFEIATTASGGVDTEVYFSLRSNGNDSNIIAFNDNRSSITITRIGDASL